MANGELVFAGIAPHPPVMVPDVGGERAKQVELSQQTMHELAERLKASEPDTVIMMTPHGHAYRDAMSIYGAPWMRGDLGQFRAPNVEMLCQNDFNLVHLITQVAHNAKVPTVVPDLKQQCPLDHGLVTPYYFLEQAKLPDSIKWIPLVLSFLPIQAHYNYGQAIAYAIQHSGQRVAFIASGDWSHRTNSESKDYTPRGEEFDQLVIEYVKNNDWESYLNIEPKLVHEAGECGYRTLATLTGVLKVMPKALEFLSFESPFGVGYLVAASKSEPKKVKEIDKSMFNEEGVKADGLVDLARQTIEEYVKNGKQVAIHPETLPEFAEKKAGIFVSLHLKDKSLRGCIGTISPTQDNVLVETVTNAISASTKDPRFPPVQANELEDLVYSVSVLHEPESIDSLEQLDVVKYGVIVTTGDRKGLLLPNIEGVTSVEQQVGIAMQKAGIGRNETIWLYRFQVDEYKEEH